MQPTLPQARLRIQHRRSLRSRLRATAYHRRSTGTAPTPHAVPSPRTSCSPSALSMNKMTTKPANCHAAAEYNLAWYYINGDGVKQVKQNLGLALRCQRVSNSERDQNRHRATRTTDDGSMSRRHRHCYYHYHHHHRYHRHYYCRRWRRLQG